VRNSFIRDLILLLVLALIWSSSFAVIKVGVQVLPPATLALMRVAIGALVLWGWLKISHIPLPTEPRLWGSFFLIGVFGNALPFVLINWGEEKIASGLAAILVATMPLAALLLGRFFSDEVLNARRILGVLVGLVGVVVVIGPQEVFVLGDHTLRQIAVAVAAFCYAIAAIFVRKLPAARPAQHGAGMLIASTAVLLPASLIVDQPWSLDYSPAAVAAAIYLGVFPTAVATLLLVVVIASRGVTFLSLNNYLIPALGVLWGFLFLDEPVTWATFGALGLIVVGIAITGAGPSIQKDLDPKS